MGGGRGLLVQSVTGVQYYIGICLESCLFVCVVVCFCFFWSRIFSFTFFFFVC
jgi:hypothetical protein